MGALSTGGSCALLLYRNSNVENGSSGWQHQSPDLDNRAKLLIDAMTIPNMSISHQMLGGIPLEDEKPFYVLLEDDKWVTRIVIDSATLLTPVDSVDENHMQAIIKVSLKPQFSTGTNAFAQ